tara:strand:- start:60 stop:305 length:246 start_codon:yes stop_codon:yes gene_type:complete
MKRKDESPNQPNIYHTTVEFMSPNKMLVESATMIYIIAFMLAMFVMLVWRGSSLSSSQVLMGAFGLLFTFAIAVRQFASFR